jgi:hypothetical protein
MKNLKNLRGAKVLSTKEQQVLKGGGIEIDETVGKLLGVVQYDSYSDCLRECPASAGCDPTTFVCLQLPGWDTGN